jgi:predicted ATPase
MAYPDSYLYQLTPEGIEKTVLEETEHYIVMKHFLNNKQRILHELFEGE